jgi:hypothetical protein
LSIIEVIRLLIAIQKIIELILNAVVERQKAGNLDDLQAAVSLLKEAKTDDEKRLAVAKLRAAFRQP